MDPDKHLLDDAVHLAIFNNDIVGDLFGDTKSPGEPVAVIFGGQPGAGKSAAVDAAVRELKQHGGAVQIIGDDLRAYHPNYAALMEQNDKTAAFYTDRDTGRWIEMAIAYAIGQRVNIVIEGTMRDGNKVAATMQSLRAACYKIHARALAVNERLSQQGIIQRYESQRAARGSGRMTTPEAHQAAYVGMAVTLERIEREKLADSVTLYRRGAIEIYRNALQDGAWISEPRARACLDAERNRPMTLLEQRNYADGFEKLAEMLARPERQASQDEIRKIHTLLRHAKRELTTNIFE